MADKKFFQETWQGILAGAGSLLVLGAVSFVFSSANARLTEVEADAMKTKEGLAEITTLLTSEVRLNIGALGKGLDKASGEINMVGNQQHSLERSVDRLEIIIGEIK